MAKASILEIKARGAIVLLENNEKAWLPGYEISTQYNPSKKLAEQNLCLENQELHVDQVLDVIEYGTTFGGKQKLVSHIRFSNDPWKKVETWQNNETKEMKIDSVIANRAFGVIEPGILGFVDLNRIYNSIPFPRSWDHFKLISAGDIIVGYVKTGEIDHHNRLVKLNLIEYIKNLSHIPEFLPILQKNTDTEPKTKDAGTGEKREWINQIPHGIRHVIRHVMVVDNEEIFLKEIGDYLESCGIETTRSTSVTSVNHFLEDPTCLDMDIALVDINLTGDIDYLGFKVVEAIAQFQPRCRIIMTTGDSVDLKKISTLAGNLPISGFLYKPFGIEEWNQTLSWAMQENPRKLGDFFNPSPREETPPLTPTLRNRSYHKLVSALRKEIEAEVVALFSIHPLSYNVNIEAYSGSDVMRDSIEDYLEKLRYSPVKDVAIDKENIFEMKITNTPRHSKHRWLFTALRYESCIGYPIPVTSELEYCIFAFHGLENFFDKMDCYKIESTAEQIAQAMEIERLEKTIRAENPFYMAGKTYGSMAHDLSNALNREFGISTILNIIDTQTVITGDDKIKLRENLAHIGDELKRAKEIVYTFRRMSRSQHEAETVVNVPEILQKVSETIKIETDALNTGIKVTLPQEGTTIPAIVKIKQTAFEQVLFNLFLNAAQQIKRFSFAREKGEKGEIEENGKKGDILAEYSIINDEDAKDYLRVLVHDSGPGIHSRDFEKVFEKGYTTKEDGSGMGLDICRNILDQAGGKIRVLKSILFCGTTFEILLPLHKK